MYTETDRGFILEREETTLSNPVTVEFERNHFGLFLSITEHAGDEEYMAGVSFTSPEDVMAFAKKLNDAAASWDADRYFKSLHNRSH